MGWDYSNLELRIWGYECGNKEFIRCFENGENVHLMIARELFPQLIPMSDDDAKETKEYKRTKNGDFAIIYGASPRRADLTYGLKGAYDRLNSRFPEVRAFTAHLHEQVRTRGYIETLTGYRLWIPKSDPHKAVSGRVQGTAGSLIGRAMIEAANLIRDTDINMILQVHDELVFDAPADYDRDMPTRIAAAMSSQGDKIGIPTPVSGSLIKTNWSEGEPL